MRPGECGLSRTGAVEHFAHADAAIDEFGARGLDVGHDQIESARRARRGRRESLAEVDRARRARRRELHAPELVTDHEVSVEPPTQFAVEALGAIDVRNRNYDGLELEVHLATHLALLFCLRSL